MRDAVLLLTLVILGQSLSAADVPSAADLDAVVAQLAKYEHGGDRTPLAKLDEWLRSPDSSPGLARQIEDRLVQLLGGKATPPAIEEACRRLSLIGTAKSVPALARLLAVPATAEMARYALERIPGPEASRALRNALPKATGSLRISLINSLGARRDNGALAMLEALARSADEKAAAASLIALGEIGAAPACRSLDRIQPNAPALRQALWDSRLRCAERLQTAGQNKAAYAAYERIYAKASTSLIQAAALKEMARLDRIQARPALESALRGSDPTVQAAAIRALATAADGSGAALLRREFPQLSPRAQAQALSALVERGDASLRSWLAEAAQSQSIDVQLAAVGGLARFGNASDVPLLASLAASAQEPVSAAARRALVSLRGSDVDRVIAAEMARAEPKTRLELVRAAGERNAAAANAELLRAARDQNRDLRREALRALANTATRSELGPLAELVAQPISAADLREAQRTLAAVLPRLESAPAGAVLDAYAKAAEPDPRAALLAAIAQSGRAEFLPLLRRELQSTDAPTRRAAIVALSQWPTPEPMPELLEAARKDSSPSLRTLALRGYIRLAGLPAERTPAQTAALLAEAMKLAAQPEEKKSILALLARAPCPESLALAQAAAADPAVSAEAKAAVDTIRKSLQ